MMALYAITLLVLVVGFCHGLQIASDGYITHKFQLQKEHPPIHLLLDNNSDTLYISAVNRLYQLDANLNPTTLIEVKTGPVNDSVRCLPYGRCDGKPEPVLDLTDNYNKLFLMDSQNNRVIVCGSVYQGICEARSLSNISNIVAENQCKYRFADKEDCAYRDYAPVTCLDRNCTSVAVIAEGPTVYNSVMYTATSASAPENYYAPKGNILTTRSLHINATYENYIFGYAVDTAIGDKSELLEPSERKITEGGMYNILYNYAFATEGIDGFVYFIFQREGEPATVISRLCKQDDYLRSYITIKMTCGGKPVDEMGQIINAYYQKSAGSQDMNVTVDDDGLLYVTFKDNGGGGSSLCVYTLKDINEAFDAGVLACYRHNGENETGDKIVVSREGSFKCKLEDPNSQKYMSIDQTLDDNVGSYQSPTLPYYPHYKRNKPTYRCGVHFLPKMLEILVPLKSAWWDHHRDAVFSGLTVDLVDEKINVAFIGTTGGDLIELNVNHKKVFNSIKVGSPVIAELVLDKQPTTAIPHLYVPTAKEILRLKVSKCSRHKTCSDCLGATDPYCGWCILNSSCIPKTEDCPLLSWLKPLSNQCVEATVQEPLERNLQETVVIQVKLLPALAAGDKYECVFDGIPSPAIVDSSNREMVRCTAPEGDQLPSNFPGEDYVNVSLSIHYNGKTEIVSTHATFYQCSAHGKTINTLQPCQSCMVNQWRNKCSWCVQLNECVSVNTTTVKCLDSEKQCPMITSGNRSQVLPIGVSREIVLDVTNLPPEAGDDMTCKVMIENDKSFRVKAQLTAGSPSRITCASREYGYSQAKIEVPANVSVYWKPDFTIDVKEFNPIVFYNCTVSHDDCSLCVTSKPEYRCGWCGSKCVIESMCSRNWVTDDANCPGPAITSFSPKNGPVGGNTVVNIFGTNMGVRVADIEEITVAGMRCDVIPELYQISNKVSCRLDSSSSSAISGKIRITVRSIEAASADDFQFKEPILETLSTPEGPESGGTTVRISGKHLDIGSERSVYFGDYVCDRPVVISENLLECITSNASKPISNLTVTVVFDGKSVPLTAAFSYIRDPKITSFSTATGSLATFLAGGRDIVFSGERLHVVQKANLIALVSKETLGKIFSGKRRRRGAERILRSWRRLRRSDSDKYERFSSSCRVENSTRMICPTPEISGAPSGENSTDLSDAGLVMGTLYIRMDNVKKPLLKDTVTNTAAKLTYYPNPIIYDLKPRRGLEIRGGSLLEVNASHLNPDAVDPSEIIVTIGDLPCDVDSVKDRRTIRCKVPEKRGDEQNQFEVTVKIGNMTRVVGEVQYSTDGGITDAFKIPMIVGGVVITIILIALGVFCFRKQKHYIEHKKGYQIELENLEKTVQADFRKAFAELSIDMTDLADIGDVGLPVLTYRQYASNMFFPNYHPCMKEPNPNDKPIPGVHQGFVQFDLLISNKQFLMAFISTLEQQKGFSNRDKGNVASLITVVLHKKLDYFTEVMKSLITDLVAASVERNPKVVLRRTESVAERMFSNWLAICLFQFIKETAGKPLFLLQKAIKHQVSKGPLDEITGKTRYTLSDDSLLKEDIPCDILTLFVSQKEMNPEEPIIVKVLSCDTISQVKEKIMDAVYKKVPFSQRPRAEQLDLEWRHGRGGHLILPGNDHVNDPTTRWRRVMTIKDYKVENNATMTLVQREQKIDDMNESHFTSNGADSSVVSPMLPDDNARVYHLVKYADELEQKRESSILRDKHKHILDLYLLRLINMKGILQNYVDEVFRSILDTDAIPPAVKHFFDYLDELAKSHSIEDEEILHLWKTNSVLGRFWVTILKSPESVFDIDKPESVASSMAVISQTFIDACSVQEHQPTKDSPINKQLYAKEIPTYKNLVQKYYADIRQLPTVSDQDMSAHMTEISRCHDLEFDVHAAHNELWGYVNKYYEEIQETLSNDPNVTQLVIQRLQQAYTLIYSSIDNP